VYVLRVFGIYVNHGKQGIVATTMLMPVGGSRPQAPSIATAGVGYARLSAGYLWVCNSHSAISNRAVPPLF